MKDTCYAQYIFRKSHCWTEREERRKRTLESMWQTYYVMSTFVTYRQETQVYKQSLYRPEQALRVSAGWGSQTSRQSAHECGKVVSLMNRQTLPARDIPDYINEKFQRRHRESNPRLSGLYCSASTKCATGLNGIITLGEGGAQNRPWILS